MVADHRLLPAITGLAAFCGRDCQWLSNGTMQSAYLEPSRHFARVHDEPFALVFNKLFLALRPYTPGGQKKIIIIIIIIVLITVKIV